MFITSETNLLGFGAWRFDDIWILQRFSNGDLMRDHPKFGGGLLQALSTMKVEKSYEGKITKHALQISQMAAFYALSL